MVNYELLFLKALALTIGIETIVLFLISKFFARTLPVKPYQVIFLGFLCSLATLPYLWFVLPKFITVKITYHISAETIALFVESVIIMGVLKCKYYKAFLVSLACNGASYLIGLLLNVT